MKKHASLWILASGLLLQSNAALLARSPDSVAEILSVQGTGHMRADASQEWRVAVSALELFGGNFVRTGGYSRMGLLFRDRTQIRLHENTLLEVRQVYASGGTEPTRLRLREGRTWAQSKSVPGNLYIETPSATAAIRGTDWELDVAPDGTSTLVVFSGEVEFFNEFGRVTVAQNEAAVAIPGQPPVKILISNPTDRIQWVTAYELDPLRHISLTGERSPVIEGEPPGSGGKPESAFRRARILADLGNWSQAEQVLKPAMDEPTPAAETVLTAAFLALRKGEIEEARRRIDQAISPRAPAFEQELRQLAQIAWLIQSQRYATALGSLQDLVQRADLIEPAAFLILSDLMVYAGRLDRALDYAQQGLQRFPSESRLHAQLARVHLAQGRSDLALDPLVSALAADPVSIQARLLQGDRARYLGNAGEAIQKYREVIADRRTEDRAWYGLGVVDGEREALGEARKDLRTALQLRPYGAGYDGELGTIETLANNLAAAEAAFRRALQRNPADYVALTGLGLLQLKRGDTEQALESFLKAGTMEPRYARAHVYSAIAYYQLEQPRQALEELDRASMLDERDPLPYFFKSMIFTDLFRPTEALAAGQKALELLPYLKSLNQVLSDRQGGANLGRALAFFGMSEWAQHAAQQSYYPFWAGSHLFLASRYQGLYTSNSELVQGFLSDPTVFGAGTRFQSLVARPGNHASVFLGRAYSSDVTAYLPSATLNGMIQGEMPVAYFLDYDRARLDYRGDTTGRDTIPTWTGALGAKLREDIGIFIYGSHQDLDSQFDTTSQGTQASLVEGRVSNRTVLGGHYKISPTSQVWAAAGRFDTTDDVQGILAGSNINAQTLVRQPDYGLRHTFSLDKHELTWGIEYSRRITDFEFFSEVAPGAGILQEGAHEEKSTDYYLSGLFKIFPSLKLQTDAWWQRHVRKATYAATGIISGSPFPLVPADPEDFSSNKARPRVGFVYEMGESRVLRLAYQKWMRPAGLSTLGPVATAGIPVDDRLVSRGGEMERYRGQVEWKFSPSTFSMAFLESKRIDNSLFLLTPFTISEEENLYKVSQQRDFARLITEDLYEFFSTPTYESGKIEVAGVSINHVLNRRTSVFGRYIRHRSENTSTANAGREIPFLPRDTVAFGATFVSPSRWFVVGRAVYRSRRFTDEANSVERRAGWNASMDVIRESADKRWSARLGLDDLFDRDAASLISANVVYRF